jgi:hypothetical protein
MNTVVKEQLPLIAFVFIFSCISDVLAYGMPLFLGSNYFRKRVCNI